MKYTTNKPVYLQIARDLVTRLYRQEIPIATLLPSVRQLSMTYLVTPKTIQAVTAFLAENKIIARKPSVGSVVTNNFSDIKDLHHKFGLNETKSYLSEMQALHFLKQEIIELLKLEIRKDISND